MEGQDRGQNKGQIEVQVAPIMTVPAEEVQVHLPAVFDPAFPAGDQNKFHQQTDTGYGCQEQKHYSGEGRGCLKKGLGDSFFQLTDEPSPSALKGKEMVIRVPRPGAESTVRRPPKWLRRSRTLNRPKPTVP